MENLDKYFREEFNNMHGAYDDKHWFAAQQYLHQVQRKRKRRAAGWLFGSVALCSALVLSVLLLRRDGTFDTLPIAMNEEKEASSDLSNLTEDQIITLKNHKYFSDNSGEKESNQFFKNSVVDNIYDTKTSNLEVSFPDNKSGSSAELREKLSSPDYYKVSKHPRIEEGQVSENENQQVIFAINDDKIVIASESKYEIINELLEGQKVNFADSMIYLDLIEDESEDHALEELPNKDIKRIKTLRYFHSIHVGMVFNPAYSADQLFFLGANASYQFNLCLDERWIFGLGLGYLHRWGTFDVMIDHPTPVYTFTKDDRGYSLIPTDAAYIQSQMIIGYRIKKLSAGISVSPNILLGARGKVIAYERLSEGSAPGQAQYRSSAVSSGWIETPGFRKIHVETGFWLEMPVNNRFSLLVKAGVVPYGIVRTNYRYQFDHNTSEYLVSKESGLLENRYQCSIQLNYRL